MTAPGMPHTTPMSVHPMFRTHSYMMKDYPLDRAVALRAHTNCGRLYNGLPGETNRHIMSFMPSMCVSYKPDPTIFGKLHVYRLIVYHGTRHSDPVVRTRLAAKYDAVEGHWGNTSDGWQ